MGCLNSTTSVTRKKISPVRVGTAKTQQGVHELKQNYIINDKTKVLGAGKYGRVFKTVSTKDKSIQVAIKVLDKHKLID